MRDLILLFWSEVVLDAEPFPDLICCLSPHHIGYRFAANINQVLDVQKVGSLSRVNDGRPVQRDVPGITH
jgi:hypothetical protein